MRTRLSGSPIIGRPKVEGAALRVHLDEIGRHDYGGPLTSNPTGVVPVVPEIDITLAHGRTRPGAGRTAP
ncbi:MAG: hypothetical protein EXQ96_02260 [Alphaproteobacteria bacterium]|nr:hypothetical protein [Alphaproteobacteria bacterium]